MAVEPSDAAVRRLSRLVAANSYPELDNVALSDALKLFSVADMRNRPPSSSAWVESYDMNGAAAECIRWKLAAAAIDVSFTADGSTTTLDQLTQHLTARLADFEARRFTGTITVTPYALA